MTSLPQARMATQASGTWVLYVLTDAPCMEWPMHDFGRVTPMPTVQERIRALTALGYAVADGPEWEWNATRTSPAPRHLWAAIAVRALTPAGAGGDGA
ncbi:DUF6303 family protein [[Kitasatospora] papulosa]|uniref:DUF6303 family protein n=1 Tax=[Kitasatospora] papulosa TaxID=1464011 RepID=UPI002258C3CF|nr:DUF6303 family protein [[Kitasatospora] papulosa]MCX4415637.1 DUF6303 family protein [[Kitasatospora] papulosa]